MDFRRIVFEIRILYDYYITVCGREPCVQSAAFAQGRDAGVWVGRFKKEGAAALAGAPVTLVADAAAVRAELDRFLDVE